MTIDCLNCPRCGSTSVTHAGSSKGKRIYRCIKCKSKFSRESRYNMLAGTSVWNKSPNEVRA